jgi:hypothetical protein
MRLTHSPSLRGLAVLGAGATLLGSAILAGAQAANASAPSTQAQPLAAVAMADSVRSDTGISMPGQQVLRDEDNNGDSADNSDADVDQERYGDHGDHGDHGKHGKHHKRHHGKGEAEHNWGSRDDNGRDDDGGDWRHKKCHHGERDGESYEAQDDNDNDKDKDKDKDEKGRHHRHHHKCHHRPWGHVESGQGGMAVASSSEQSPVTSISLGLASAALLGSGLWMVRRTRHFGAVK